MYRMMYLLLFCTNVSIILYRYLVSFCWTLWKMWWEWYWNRWGSFCLLFCEIYENEIWSIKENVGETVFPPPGHMNHSRYFNVSTALWTGCDLLMVYCGISWMSNVCFKLTKLLEVKVESCWFYLFYSPEINKNMNNVLRWGFTQFIFKTEHYWLN